MIMRMRRCEGLRIVPASRNSPSASILFPFDKSWSSGSILTLDVTRNDLVFLKGDHQLPGQADQRLRLR
jgi:hypothetical protein